MCVYIYMYINICIYMFLYICAYIYIYLFIYTYICACVFIDYIYGCNIYIYQTTPCLEQNSQGQETFLAPSADNLI